MSKTERTLQVLEYLSTGNPPSTHAELMRATGIQRSTLSDLLAELHALGYLDMRERRYLPGLRLLALVHSAAREPGFNASIRHTLETLAERSGETAVYVIERRGRDGRSHVVAVDQVESTHSIRYVASIGEPYPMHTTAAGRALLAATRRSASSLGTERVPPDLDDDLARARDRGFAVLSEAPDSATSIAAAIYDRSDSLVGAVSIVGPSERVGVDTIGSLLRVAVARLRDERSQASTEPESALAGAGAR